MAFVRTTFRLRLRALVVFLVLAAISAFIGCGGISLVSRTAPQTQITGNTVATLALSPSVLNFGTVAVGQSLSFTGSLSASNADIIVSSATWNGSGYSVSGITFPVTVVAGTSTNYTVTFSPEAAGTFSGSISFVSNASDSSLTQSLVGEGTDTSGQLPATLAVSPSALNFGTVAVGQSLSFTGSLSASNADIIVSSATWNGSGYSVSGITFPVTVVAGTSTDYTVTFSPEAAGTFSGSISFVSNASDSSLTQSLIGEGTNTSGKLPIFGPAFVPLNPTCTIYVSPAGGGSGGSYGSPTTISGAIAAETAGSVVCFEAGTYNISSTVEPTASGTASNYITWVDYQWLTNGETFSQSGAVLTWTGGAGTNEGTGRFLIQFAVPYRAFLGLTLNGEHNANQGLLGSAGCHHYVEYGLQVTRFIYSGLVSSQCSDYYTIINNWVWQNGENPNGLITVARNAGSGITPNQTEALAGDSYAGLHNIIADNIVSGQFDPTSGHTDGSGISLDLVKVQNTGGTLVLNNVVYGNGARCIEVNSGFYYPSDVYKNVIVANNTCYQNDLDLTLLTPNAQFENNESTNVYYINNISYAWAGWSGGLDNWYEYNTTGTEWAGGNIWYQGLEGVSQGLTDANPMFLNPPLYNASAGGQYANSPSPAALGNGLALQAGSPAIGAGVDPSTVSGISSTQIATDMQTGVMGVSIYTDINGNTRSSNSFDLGAYQVSTVANPTFTPGAGGFTGPIPEDRGRDTRHPVPPAQTRTGAR
jgi:hypothetical protein